MGSSITSMTGFARGEGVHGDRRWTWEIKSVNGRGLEMRCRVPQGFDFIEPDLRKALQKKLHRGSLNVSLSLRREAGDTQYRVNEDALAAMLAMVERINMRIPCDPPRPEGLLSLRGVLEIVDEEENDDERKALAEALLASFKGVIKSLIEARRKEGERLSVVLSDQLNQIEKLASTARKTAASAPKALRDKITDQLEKLLSGAGIPEERLAQEAALLAVKADVREELDRLDAHIQSGRALLNSPEPAGRPLDFLTQEFNREANTLCSKASDMELKSIGLELKKTIDQMREQVQNVE